MKTDMRTVRKSTELLAPAGDELALRAAVCAGADAVYLGFSSFGARAAAANFDEAQLIRAVEYAHLHHVRVYVTVNTLVKEQELENVYQALETIALARADAVIVQDVGVVAMARRFFPTLALHASTQMGIHNAQGASWAKGMGMERVVLARECALSEIREVVGTGVETEVFVHGALCAGVSGQCLMSSMAGGRSGNRGRCAQPCRQQVRLDTHRGALISLRDLYLRDDLPALVAAGVRSLKVEGRLKRPEYVAVVVDSYRRALDEVAKGNFVPGDAGERERLMQAFHRGGFTRGHAMGIQDAELCATEHVGHGGIGLGRVVVLKNGLATVRLTKAVCDGDGLQLRGRAETDLRYSGKDRKAGEDAILRLRPDHEASVGDSVFRLTDVRQMEWAQALKEAPIPMAMEATLKEGEPVRLTLSDGENTVFLERENVQRAKTQGLTPQEVTRQLSKLGDTGFFLPENGSVSIRMEDGLFLPVSALNALRREGVQRLAETRRAAFFGQEKEAALANSKFPSAAQAVKAATEDVGWASPWTDALAVSFGEAARGRALLDAGATLLLWEPWDLRPEALEEGLAALPEGAWLKLPPQLSGSQLAQVVRRANERAGYLGGVALGSVGQLGAGFRLPVALGSGVPVTNRWALEALRDAKPAFYTLWPEWSYTELRETPKGQVPSLLGVYGRERLMLLRHCPHRVAMGLGSGRRDCDLCKGQDMACGQENAALVDRKGYRFPLSRTRTEEGCVVNVLNALPTDLREQEDKRRALGAGMLVTLTVEPWEEQLQTVKEFGLLLRGESIPKARGTTTGHWLRGVE